MYDGLCVSMTPPDVAAPARAGRGDRHVCVPAIWFVVSELDCFTGLFVYEPYEMVISSVSQCFNLRLCLGKSIDSFLTLTSPFCLKYVMACSVILCPCHWVPTCLDFSCQTFRAWILFRSSSKTWCFMREEVLRLL